MKKMYFLLLLSFCISLFSYAQDDDANLTDPELTPTNLTPTNLSPTSGSQTNTWTSRCPYCYTYHYPYCKKCSICYRYHTPNCTPQQTPAPIDGGISLLLVAGAAYGAKRMRRKNQK